VHEFLPGVLSWSWFSEPHGSDFNGTLLLNAEGNLCVDPVDPTMQKEAATQLDALLAVRGE